MKQQHRISITGGIFLLLCGGVFLYLQLAPGLGFHFSWPWGVVMCGILLIGLGAALGVPDLTIPAILIGGIGGILVFQRAANYYFSWIYLWTLVPGLVGIGLLFSRLLRGTIPIKYKDVLTLLLISFTLLAIFGSIFGILGLAGQLWPIFLIGLGALLVIRPFINPK